MASFLSINFYLKKDCTVFSLCRWTWMDLFKSLTILYAHITFRYCFPLTHTGHGVPFRCSRRWKWESMNICYHRFEWLTGRSAWLAIVQLTNKVKFSHIMQIKTYVVCSVHITTLVGFIHAPLTKLTDGDNVQQKKIFSAMPHEFSHRHKMTHPPEQNIKEEKSWKPSKWNGTEFKSWHLKIRIVGFSVSTL